MAKVNVHFEYREQGAGSWTLTGFQELTDIGEEWKNFDQVISSLDPDTNYEIRAVADYEDTEYKSDIISFQTPPEALTGEFEISSDSESEFTGAAIKKGQKSPTSSSSISLEGSKTGRNSLSLESNSSLIFSGKKIVLRGNFSPIIPSNMDFLSKKTASGNMELVNLGNLFIHASGTEPRKINETVFYQEEFLGKKVAVSPHLGDYQWSMNYEADLELELDLGKQFQLDSSYQHLFGYVFGLEPQTIAYVVDKIAQKVQGAGIALEASTLLEAQGKKTGKGLFEELVGLQVEITSIKVMRSPTWQITFTYETEFEGNRVELFFTYIYLQGRLYRSVGLEGRLYAEEEMQGRLGVV